MHIMNSIPSITSLLLLVFFSSPTTKAERAGNLSLCTSANDKHNCLGSSDDGKVIVLETISNAEEEEEPKLNWLYEDGFLRPSNADHLCLQPTVQVLDEASSEPYELRLTECPLVSNNENKQQSFEERATNRHMRFLVGDSGRVQSLASVRDGATGEDVIHRTPFCLTLETSDNQAYLMPCIESSVQPQTQHQMLDVSGTYSGSFVVPLGFVWGYDDVVPLAYQIGLPSTTTEEHLGQSPIVELSIPYLVSAVGSSMVVDVFATNGHSGIVYYAPSDQKVSGPMTATLSTIFQKDDDVAYEITRTSKISFFVSPTVAHMDENNKGIVGDTTRLGNGPNGNYVIFVLVLGCFVGCFLFSVLLEKMCQAKTRTVEESNDGKTVCLEDDLYLEDDDEEEEEHADVDLHKPNQIDAEEDNTTDTDSDMDKSLRSNLSSENIVGQAADDEPNRLSENV
jgi:hypothetical protein